MEEKTMADLRKILEREMAKSSGAAKLIKRTKLKLTEKDLKHIKHNQEALNAEFKANQAMRLRSFEKASNQFLK